MQRMDMLHGSLGDKTLLFAVPLAFTGIIQQLFNTLDTAIMGQFAGKEAMAAVGSTSPLVGFLTALFIGMALGANVVISHFIGEGNKEGVEKGVYTSFFLSAVIGLFSAAAGEVILVPVLEILAVPSEIMDMTVLYMRILLLSMPALLLYNMEAALYRSQGDTRTPLMALVVSGVVKLVLSLVLVIVFRMGTAGVALSTLAGSLLSAGILFFLLSETGKEMKLSLSSFSWDGRVLLEILRIGAPAGIQGAVFSLSNLVVQAAINSLGAEAMAASAAAFNVECLAYYVINAFGQTATTFIGQNFGAGNRERCRRTVKICFWQDMAVTILMSGLLIYFVKPLMGLFTADSLVIEYGALRLTCILLSEPLNVVMEIISGMLRGYGRSMGPAVITLLSVCGSRLFYIYFIFSRSPDFLTLVLVYPLSWFITDIGLVVLAVLFYRETHFAGVSGKKRAV